MSERRSAANYQTWIIIGLALLIVACLCVGVVVWAGDALFGALPLPGRDEVKLPRSATADLTVAVSPGMAPTLNKLVETFNARGLKTPDNTPMVVRTLTLVPEEMVAQSLGQPAFQALAPDSSLWLSQIDRQWAAAQGAAEGDESVIPIGYRRFSNPVRYAVSPVVIAAWESVARELGWPERAVGWQDIQNKATADPNFKWNHPSTGHASGLLATLAEFYAGAGLTRGLTPEAATAQATLDYVRAVEATVRFYGEGEDAIVSRLAGEGRGFLDAFVTQEQLVIHWNQTQSGERLIALYPAEGTLWADHPLALLELGAPGETPLSDNQRRTYRALADYLTSPEAQQALLAAGYRPADMTLQLDAGNSPFLQNDAVDWRQPQTTLQIPDDSVVAVVQNVWWYTKRPTNVFLVVDTSGSMQGNKIDLTKLALHAFIDQIRGDRDQLGLIAFSTGVSVLRSMQPLDEAGREDMHNAVNRMSAEGNTALIDGVWEAYRLLQAQGDTEAINAIVVMTDGQENNSAHRMSELKEQWGAAQGPSVVIFTIAFGSNADEDVLRTMAEIGGGQYRRADETDIEELYKIISTYF
ncbi:MAG TPA: substrate-binding domain-containing protein [Anaerolineae bacterium]|nr:substrate-binding domain-containing protein [Anaerolineae bacterium]